MFRSTQCSDLLRSWIDLNITICTAIDHIDLVARRIFKHKNRDKSSVTNAITASATLIAFVDKLVSAIIAMRKVILDFFFIIFDASVITLKSCLKINSAIMMRLKLSFVSTQAFFYTFCRSVKRRDRVQAFHPVLAYGAVLSSFK